MNPAANGYVHATSATHILRSSRIRIQLVQRSSRHAPSNLGIQKEMRDCSTKGLLSRKSAPSKSKFPEGSKAGVIEYDPNVKVEEFTVWNIRRDDRRDHVFSICHMHPM